VCVCVKRQGAAQALPGAVRPDRQGFSVEGCAAGFRWLFVINVGREVGWVLLCAALTRTAAHISLNCIRLVEEDHYARYPSLLMSWRALFCTVWSSTPDITDARLLMSAPPQSPKHLIYRS
jgi:hypothetical protein